MRHGILTLLTVSAVTVGLAACNTTTSSSSGNGSAEQASTNTQTTAKRVRLSRAEIIRLYTGKTTRASDHSITYKPDGTWVSDSGTTGRWSVTSDGTLVLTGGLNLRLQVFRDGNRFYHRNARSGAGGYYTLG
ncbi:DUF995 domain-containing protein [Roseibium sp. FZY0029]|uniref:DUF995 domain-containing protein n=1 Tax=Roseibium sp. FZY0029 TaxID=3116647 RepID=UPI002EA561C8|nr:DUF995 domain-containing protein [Roseibium sp. FZY0029]